MSLVVVLLVSGLVLFYLHASRNRRLGWLRRLQLVGTWVSQDETILRLAGSLDGGRFELVREAVRTTGDWRMEGHTLYLEESGQEVSYDLRLFRPGSIGLTDSSGVGRIYEKENDNVVAFDRKD